MSRPPRTMYCNSDITSHILHKGHSQMLFSHKETPTPCSVSMTAARTVIKNPSEHMDDFAEQCKFLKPQQNPHLIHNVQQDRNKKSQILQEQHNKMFYQEESPRHSLGRHSVPMCRTTIKNPSELLHTCPRYLENAMLKSLTPH